MRERCRRPRIIYAPFGPRLRPNNKSLSPRAGGYRPKLVPARRVAARIGAGRVVRLANTWSIGFTGRLAITNSGSNAHAFHCVRHSKRLQKSPNYTGVYKFVRESLRALTLQIDADAGVAYHLGPLDLLGSDERAEFLRCAVRGVGACRGETIA